ncbi:MAG TPA: hypothetical protein VMW24_27980 [Sedimentisphaerales bacterium]|nr:hypothetical protein [Sedimentisphaerales bacterium]
MWIFLHTCKVCGDHAREELETWENGVPDQVHQYYVDAIVLAPCETCGLVVCCSCMDDGYCCERRAEIEGQMPLGQMDLFESEE